MFEDSIFVGLKVSTELDESTPRTTLEHQQSTDESYSHRYGNPDRQKQS